MRCPPTSPSRPPPVSAGAWAKLDGVGDDAGSRGGHPPYSDAPCPSALPLADHGADVAACLRALIAHTAYRTRLEAAAGRALTSRDIDRLCALAFLHDLGKCNAGFWRRQFALGDPRAGFAGHTNEVAALFADPDGLRRTCGTEIVAVSDDLGAVIGDWGAVEPFRAVMAHHGRPVDALSDEAAGDARTLSVWRAQPDYDPARELSKLMAAARRLYPDAFHAEPLPDAGPFVSLLAGLMTLADWIGSDAARFSVPGPHGAPRPAFAKARAERAVEALGLTPLAPLDQPGFEAAFGFAPYEAQARAADPSLGDVAVLEAETGSGKTEAAVWRYLALARAGEVDALYFALPTRTAAVQIHKRIRRLLRAAFGTNAPEPVLAVPGYLRAGGADGVRIGPFEVRWPDEDADMRAGGVPDGRWAAESPKRYLAARIAVGTIDQVLLGGLQVRHAHLRAAALSRALLVVDEVHASDVFMTRVLKTVLANHRAVGGRALLLSATLGGAARAGLLGHAIPALEEALDVPYPALSGTRAAPFRVEAGRSRKTVTVDPAPLIAAPRAVAERALAAARAGASVLVIRNTVDDALATARALEEMATAEGRRDLLFTVAGAATLHHGRFAPDDRRGLDGAVEAVLGKATAQSEAGGKTEDKPGSGRRAIVLVGTQTLEQSLDIDADLLITDLAPMDVLLQRLGRLHRHSGRPRPEGFAAPRAVVLTPETDDWGALAQRTRHGLGPLRSGEGIYPDLRGLAATLDLLRHHGPVRVPEDCRALVERATHPDALLATARSKGLETHGAGVEGVWTADEQLAAHHALDMSRPFGTLRFPDEETIRTRLGADDRLIDLDPAPPGPFGAPVARLRVPGWMATLSPEPTVTVTIVPPASDTPHPSLRLLVDDRVFTYDRHGLRLAPAERQGPPSSPPGEPLFET